MRLGVPSKERREEEIEEKGKGSTRRRPDYPAAIITPPLLALTDGLGSHGFGGV